jgi:hypothetical protein
MLHPGFVVYVFVFLSVFCRFGAPVGQPLINAGGDPDFLACTVTTCQISIAWRLSFWPFDLGLVSCPVFLTLLVSLSHIHIRSGDIWAALLVEDILLCFSYLPSDLRECSLSGASVLPCSLISGFLLILLSFFWFTLLRLSIHTSVPLSGCLALGRLYSMHFRGREDTPGGDLFF